MNARTRRRLVFAAALGAPAVLLLAWAMVQPAPMLGAAGLLDASSPFVRDVLAGALRGDRAITWFVPERGAWASREAALRGVDAVAVQWDRADASASDLTLRGVRATLFMPRGTVEIDTSSLVVSFDAQGNAATARRIACDGPVTLVFEPASERDDDSLAPGWRVELARATVDLAARTLEAAADVCAQSDDWTISARGVTAALDEHGFLVRLDAGPGAAWRTRSDVSRPSPRKPVAPRDAAPTDLDATPWRLSLEGGVRADTSDATVSCESASVRIDDVVLNPAISAEDQPQRGAAPLDTAGALSGTRRSIAPGLESAEFSVTAISWRGQATLDRAPSATTHAIELSGGPTTPRVEVLHRELGAYVGCDRATFDRAAGLWTFDAAPGGMGVKVRVNSAGEGVARGATLDLSTGEFTATGPGSMTWALPRAGGSGRLDFLSLAAARFEMPGTAMPVLRRVEARGEAALDTGDALVRAALIRLSWTREPVVRGEVRAATSRMLASGDASIESRDGEACLKAGTIEVAIDHRAAHDAPPPIAVRASGDVSAAWPGAILSSATLESRGALRSGEPVIDAVLARGGVSGFTPSWPSISGAELDWARGGDAVLSGSPVRTTDHAGVTRRESIMLLPGLLAR
jgi:hypothetical protein